MKTFLLLIALSSLLFAEDITLKNGSVWRNIKILKDGSQITVILYNGLQKSIISDDIAEIEHKEYDANQRSYFEDKSPVEVKTQSQYNPCTDKVFLKLQQKDSLTTDEMKMYVELRKMCEESKKEQREQDRKDIAVKSAEGLSSALTGYYIVSAIALIGSLIYLISLK